MSAEECARRIVRAMEKRQRILMMTLKGKSSAAGSGSRFRRSSATSPRKRSQRTLSRYSTITRSLAPP